MLTVYRSNRAEWLAEVLSEQLRLNPPAPFETPEVIVNTWPTSRWLAEKIATTNDINAKINFPFPNSQLKKVVHLFLGLDLTSDDPWITNQLVWTILDVLPELLQTHEASNLLKWMDEDCIMSNSLNSKRWALAKRLTETINEYILYRPKLIKHWWKSNEQFSESINKLPSEVKWQPILIQLLKRRINKKPICLQIYDVIDRLQRNIKPKNQLPHEITIFGVSSLAPIQVDLIQALSTVINVKIYLLTPCQDLWKRSRNLREELNSKQQFNIDSFWITKSARLEASLGRMGAEFQQLLEGTGEALQGECQEEDFFALPMQMAIHKSETPTLLEQLQENLVTSDAPKKLNRTVNDTSLLFVASPGHRRQVQIVRDQIIQWLADDNTLQPRDIIIMTPQIKKLAPLITTIFNDVASTKVSLPWKITDRSQLEKPGVIQFIIELIDTASERLTTESLDRLFCNQLIQREFKLTQEEVDKMIYCLQKTGFRWGLDSNARNGDATNSLNWCLERWMLGIILPSTTSLTMDGIAPFSENFSTDEILKWWSLLSKICEHLKSLRNSRTCNEWVALLNLIITDLFNEKEKWSWEYESLFTHIKSWQKVACNCDLKIEPRVLSDILKKSISMESGRFGHRSGNITISALEPMRAIPHKIIVLMGLDSSIFPHNETRDGFNLLGYERLLGDPKSTDKDRYILLEALMSSRQNLMLTWNCRDEKTGEVIEASSPIHQWIEYLRNELNEDSLVGLIKTPPANQLCHSNFISKNNQPPISCDTRDLQTRLYLDKGIKSKKIGLALPLQWNADLSHIKHSINNEITKKWLIAPQLTWLENLQIRPKEKHRLLESLEHLELSELERYAILNKKYLEKQININDLIDESRHLEELNWEQLLNGQGILPPKAAKNIECELLKSRWASLSSAVQDLGKLSELKLNVRNEYIQMVLAGDYLLVVEIGKLKTRSIVLTWLQHLQVCSHDIHPRKTMLITRTKHNKYAISAEFNTIDQEEASLLLDRIYLLVEQGLDFCWPVPPESGWALSKKRHFNENQSNIFSKSWEGDLQNPGENEKIEMQICFGLNSSSKIFIGNNNFENCMNELYKPILLNLSTSQKSI